MWDRIKLIITDHPVIVLLLVGFWIHGLFFVRVAKHGMAVKVLAIAGAILFLLLLVAVVLHEQWALNVVLGLAVLLGVLYMAIAPRRGD
jgi:hypothetical protein